MKKRIGVTLIILMFAIGWCVGITQASVIESLSEEGGVKLWGL